MSRHITGARAGGRRATESGTRPTRSRLDATDTPHTGPIPHAATDTGRSDTDDTTAATPVRPAGRASSDGCSMCR